MMEKDLKSHYNELLGLSSGWSVKEVDLDAAGKQVTLRLEHSGSCECAECGERSPLADHAPVRQWRHLDTMQFITLLEARVPRTRCGTCGVKTVGVPWAGKHSRYTLLFEGWVIELLGACRNINAVAKLMDLDWGHVQAIMDRAVARGLERRDAMEEEVEYMGIDEKSFLKGHSYVSHLSDLKGGRILEVVEGRNSAAADLLWSSIPETMRESVRAVAVDMWPAFMGSIVKHTRAEMVHDRFHIAKHLGEALDQVRRAENKALLKEGDRSLVGSRYLWLRNPEKLTEKAWATFEPLKEATLKTARAWAIKEQLRYFWEYRYAGCARTFFEGWYNWAIRSRLEPMKKKARMIKRHLPGILSYFRHRITNATAEGLNSKIQGIKAAAHGFRVFANYRTRILFHCGGLDLAPEFSH